MGVLGRPFLSGQCPPVLFVGFFVVLQNVIYYFMLMVFVRFLAKLERE
jgi:hypothetical protein